jgi:hypothetical protein
MAATFKNTKAVLADTATTVYTCPSATTAIVLGCQVANVGAADHTLDFYWEDTSDSSAVTYLADEVTVPQYAAYEPIGGKLVLEAGDVVKGLGDTTDVLEVTVSVLELT